MLIFLLKVFWFELVRMKRSSAGCLKLNSVVWLVLQILSTVQKCVKLNDLVRLCLVKLLNVSCGACMLSQLSH